MQTSIVHLDRTKRFGVRQSIWTRLMIAFIATTSFVTSLYHPLLKIIATVMIDFIKDDQSGKILRESGL